MTAPTIDVFIDGLNLFEVDAIRTALISDGHMRAGVTMSVTIAGKAPSFDELVSTLTTDGTTPVADDKPRPCTGYPTAGITPAGIAANARGPYQRIVLLTSPEHYDTGTFVIPDIATAAGDAVGQYRAIKDGECIGFHDGTTIRVASPTTIHGLTADLVVVCVDSSDYTTTMHDAARALVARTNGDIVYLRRTSEETSER